MFNERRSQERRRAIDRRGIAAIVSATVNINDNPNTNSKRGNEELERFSLGPFRVNKNSRSVCYNNRDLALTAKEFTLFMLLAEVHNQVCSTEKIYAFTAQKSRRGSRYTKMDTYR